MQGWWCDKRAATNFFMRGFGERLRVLRHAYAKQFGE